MTWTERTLAEAPAGEYPRAEQWEAILDQVSYLSDPPIVAVRRAAVQSIGNAAFTNVAWDTEDVDLFGMFAATSDTLTFTQAGLFEVHFNGLYAANATGANELIMRVNGGTDIGHGNTPGNATVRAITGSSYHVAAVGDTLVFIVRQSSGISLNFTGRAFIRRMR